MKHLFVTYEIAKKLKELGFDEPCLGLFDANKTFLIKEITQYDSETYFGGYSAPLWQQSIDWLREKKGWNISINEIGMYSNIEPYTKGVYTAYEYWIYNTHENKKYILCKYDSKKHIIGDFINNIAAQSYYEALNKAIEEALKLI